MVMSAINEGTKNIRLTVDGFSKIYDNKDKK
jgi:hypothetical protein